MSDCRMVDLYNDPDRLGGLFLDALREDDPVAKCTVHEYGKWLTDQAKSRRKAGFYWVRRRSGEWVVAELYGEQEWYLAGFECPLSASEFQEIGPCLEPPQTSAIPSSAASADPIPGEP